MNDRLEPLMHHRVYAYVLVNAYSIHKYIRKKSLKITQNVAQK